MTSKLRAGDTISINLVVSGVSTADGVLFLKLPLDEGSKGKPWIRPDDPSIKILAQPIRAGDSCIIKTGYYASAKCTVIEIDDTKTFVKLSEQLRHVTHIIEPVQNLRRIDNDE